jgi:hypothetical protein
MPFCEKAEKAKIRQNAKTKKNRKYFIFRRLKEDFRFGKQTRQIRRVRVLSNVFFITCPETKAKIKKGFAKKTFRKSL